MNRKITGPVIGIMLYAMSCTAQDSSALQPFKFRMIRQAAVFYTKDTALVKQHTISDCSGDTSLAALQQHLAALPKVGEKLAAFDQVPVKEPRDLEKLKDNILSEITGGSKNYRRQLPEYTAFTDSLDAIIKQATPAAAQAPDNTTVMQTDTSQQKSTDGQTDAGKDQTAIEIPIELYIAGILALLLSAVSVVLAGICFSGLKKLQRKTHGRSSPAEGRSGATSDTDLALQQEVNALRQQLERLKADVADMRAAKQVTTAVVTDSNSYHQAPAQNTVKYAKTADGNGFAADALSDRQDNKKIFELIVDGPDKGTFRVTANPDAQQFALEDPGNYLRGACKYNSYPGDNNRIITVSAGRMELNGGKWVITKPAEIEFSK